MTTIRLLLISIAAAGLLSGPGYAASKHRHKHKSEHPADPATADPGPAKTLGNAGAWTAYVAQNKSGKVCYLVAQPEKTEPSGMKRKAVMAMVTHRTVDNVANVVSFDEGYPLKPDADVVLQVGSEKFELFAKDDSAWARTSALDRQIVDALIKERQAVVKGTPRKGRGTTDTYSLIGFSKALALIDKACDIKR